MLKNLSVFALNSVPHFHVKEPLLLNSVPHYHVKEPLTKNHPSFKTAVPDSDCVPFEQCAVSLCTVTCVREPLTKDHLS